MNDARSYAREHAPRFRRQYEALLRIPTVSTLPQHAADVERAAQWLAGDMRAIGMDSAEVLHLAGGRHPLVLGEWRGAGEAAPTVLLYAHYDVQPAAMEDGWDSDPFEPVERDGRIFCRGSVDSKLHVMSQLKAVEALLATPGGAPVNIRVLLEGEEESGSETISAFVAQQPERVRADVAVISDGVVLAPDQPSLVYALRGIVTMELHVEGPGQDLHSGHFGGTLHNPLQALAEIVAQLHDAEGRVSVPGFHDDVVEADGAERALLAHTNRWSEREWEAVADAPALHGERGYNTQERIGLRPTLEINGFGGGYTGPGFKTVLPQRAMAKISCRLVPDQDPQRIYALLQDHIAAITPPTVRSELRQLDLGSRAVTLGRDTRAMRAAAAAYERAWGVAPLYERAGGSIPVTFALQEACEELVIMGFGTRDGRAHGPNENVHVESLKRGVRAMIHFLQEIGATWNGP
ncbi:MAG: M20/M25/M40 family metallo-hydrolase [Anaerolineaceae bacterium]|nr:M20/M25/M40 family metallo-hydrolase [Anaerolineaceae bacterium]